MQDYRSYLAFRFRRAFEHRERLAELVFVGATGTRASVCRAQAFESFELSWVTPGSNTVVVRRVSRVRRLYCYCWIRSRRSEK